MSIATAAMPSDADVIVDHAHNDYLEALVEGGLALFVPVVVAVVLVFRLGLRAVRRPEDRPVGGLVLGALVGFADGGDPQLQRLRAAHPGQCGARDGPLRPVCAPWGGGEREPGRSPRRPRVPATRIATSCGSGGLAPVLGAVVGGGPGARRSPTRAGGRIGSSSSGSRPSTSRRLPDPASVRRRSRLFEAATRLVPEYARLQAELAYAHLAVFEQRMEELAEEWGGAPRGPDPGRQRPGPSVTKPSGGD